MDLNFYADSLFNGTLDVPVSFIRITDDSETPNLRAIFTEKFDPDTDNSGALQDADVYERMAHIRMKVSELPAEPEIYDEIKDADDVKWIIMTLKPRKIQGLWHFVAGTNSAGA